MITDQPGERTEERGDEIAFILDCNTEIQLIPLIPVEGDDEPEEVEE